MARIGSTPLKARGFTLLELLIAVAIVGILTTVALPSYLEHLRRSARSEAQAYLMSVATRQQQFLLDTRAFSASLDSLGIPQPDSVKNRYTVTFTVNAGPPPVFTVTTAPKGSQSSDGCGTMSINQAGTKTAAKSGCW